MYKSVVLMCLMTALLLPGMAQVMPLPSMEAIRADMKKAHTDTGRANQMLNLALSYVYRPGEHKSDLDSALLWAKQAEIINRQLQDKRIEAKTCFVYSNILREGGNATGGRGYIERSLALYRTIDAPSDMGEAWIEESSYYPGDNNEGIKKKKECFQQALTLFEKSGNKLRQADALKNIGEFDKAFDNRGLSMKELKEALAIYTSIGYQQLHGVYISLAELCHAEGDFPNLARYCEMAVKYGELAGDTSLQMARIYFGTGVAYSEIGKTEAAAYYEKKAIAIAKKYGNPEYLVSALRTLCTQLVRLERAEEANIQIKDIEKIIYGHKMRLTDNQQSIFYSTQISVYTAIKQYDKAASSATEYVQLLKKHRSTDYVYIFSRELIRYFITVHQHKEAERYADSLLLFGRTINIKQALAIAFLMKSAADSAVGDLQSALTHYQMYKKVTDSLFNDASAFQLAQFQVEFDIEKKDNAIKVLQQQQEIQKVRLAQSRATNTIVIISVVVLALLLVLLYNRYRIKQGLPRQLEQKQLAINQKNSALEQLVSEKDTLLREKDTLLKEKDTLLKEKDTLLREKDGLVKEIHHRVKNNLQIVISLLNAQTEYLENPSALRAIQESRERMEAIAIIHQKLYQNENNTLVHVHAYAYELVDNLQDSFASARDIRFQLNIADIVPDISQSVPLGLILNEAITNAIKYAYRKGERGTVSISLQPTDEERLELRIADNGKGLPPNFDWKNSPSLGMQLINLLAQQLNGNLYFINKNGLEIILNFKPTRYTVSATTQARAV